MTLKNVEIERIRRDMSRDELAGKLGVTKRTLRNWLNGTTMMPVHVLVALSEEWGTTVDYLLGLTERRTPYDD